MKDTIVDLGVARCSLTSLPIYVSTFNNLKYLDARDNSLDAISEKLKVLLRKNDVEAYFSGNSMLCDVEEEFDCTPLCSNTCWSKRVKAMASVIFSVIREIVNSTVETATLGTMIKIYNILESIL